MARGTARFDADILKKLRASRKVDGCLLSAAELARRLKTSKARVLSYEQGTSVPEPGRVVQMAKVFNVQPRQLYEARTGKSDQIKDLRSYAGLTAAELAARIGVSRTTYRDIERLAMLPARDDGALPLRLAEVLGLPLSMIHKALDHHPAAAERRTAIADHLSELFRRAEVQHRPALVNPDDETLLQVSELLHRPASVVCRLVNYDLGRYRDLLRRLAVAQVNVSYAQTPRAAHVLAKDVDGLRREIARRPFAAASAQLQFLSEAMTSQQWRTVVSLRQPGRGVRFSPEVFHDLQADQVWDGLIARRFIQLSFAQEGITATLTALAWDDSLAQRRYYECLYPRVPVPRSAIPASPYRAQLPAAPGAARLPRQKQQQPTPRRGRDLGC